MARKSKKGISVNLSDAESYFRPPEGGYQLEIIGVEMGEGNSLAWDFKVKAGKFKGKEFRDYTSLEPNALWRVRQLVEATGADVEDADVDLEYFEGLVGESLSARVAYREWEGKEKINVTYELPGAGDDDEVPPKRGKRNRDEDEEDSKPARSRRRDDDDEEEKPRGKRRSKDDDNGEEEEEEEKPRSRRRSKDDDEEEDKPARGKGKKKADLTQEEIRDMDTDELETLIEKNELDVDLSKIKTLKKQQNAVIDAASEAGLLSD